MSPFDRDHWQEILETLARNKMRTFLTAFGVFWGIFMLMVMLGSGNGLSNGIESGFADGATNSFFVWSQRPSKPYRGMLPGRELHLDLGDVAAIQAQVPEVEVLCPRNQLGGWRGNNNITRGRKSGAFVVYGDYPEIARLQSVRMVAGRFLNALDIAERRKVAVLGPRSREVLFDKDEDPLGEDIRISGVYFKVIGVFAPRRSGEDREDDVQSIFVPFTTFQSAFNFGDRVGWFAATSREGSPASAAEDKTLALLRERHRVAPDDNRAFGHFNVEKEFAKVRGLFAGIRLLIWIVGTGTLAAGVIGVSNIMLVIVRERTNEIGVRRAVGATPWAIMTQVVFESLVLTSVAGYLGLVAGVAAIEATSRLVGEGAQMFKNPEVSLGAAVQTLAILVLSGLLAGLFPARRAVQSTSVEALRAIV
ncbi:MAG TPA: ABC transporter permease [Candidatus Polarisedimenticolia bacterium]|nr:ABC transporter permease [Candidatus Polarisedimenticolia bacterium]